MFRRMFKRSGIWLSALFLLALVSRPLFTAVHSRTGRAGHGTPARSATGIDTKEKRAKEHQPNNDYGKLPVYFERNVGQADSQVKFIARGTGVTTFLTATEAVFSLPIADCQLPIEEFGEEPTSSKVNLGLQTLAPGNLIHRPIIRKQKSAISNPQSAITMRFEGANPNAQIEGVDRLPGISNYFIGNDPKKWRTNVPLFAKVKYRDVYPGIDLVYYGNERDLEYDLVVKPGADPKRIELAFEGADEIQVNSDGDLLVKVGDTELLQRSPRIFQPDGKAQSGNSAAPGQMNVAGHYVVRDKRRVGFQLSSYDVSQSFIIDPVIVYSSFLGGSEVEFGAGIAVDSTGNAYVTGSTSSADFPVTPEALQPQRLGYNDVFVGKLNAKGNSLIFMTYLGGSGFASDHSRAIALDSAGNAYIAGWTESVNFPVTVNAYQRTHGGGACEVSNPCFDAFFAKLNPDGNLLLYSSYLGGSGEDQAYALTVDSSGSVTLAGTTAAVIGNGRAFPVTPGAYQTSVQGDLDGFVSKFSPNGSSLTYSTLLGGAGFDYISALATDVAGNSYVTGRTSSRDLPVTPGALQSTYGGPAAGTPGGDAFVTKVNSNGTGLVYSTYLGGSGADAAYSIAVDSLGNAYFGGLTASSNFPVSTSAFQRQLRGFEDGFLSKLNSSGTALVFSTLLGGTHSDYIFAIALDSSGRTVATGRSGSVDFPLETAPFGQDRGGSFVALLNNVGDQLLSSISLGGGLALDESGYAIAVDASGDAYVVGTTLSVDFPTVYPFQPRLGIVAPGLVWGDASIAKVSFGTNLPERLFVPIVLSTSGANGSYFTSELTLTNRASQEARLEFTYTTAIGSGSGTATDTLPAGRQKVVRDALAYLRSLGIPIPDNGNQGGTLSVLVRGVPASNLGLVVKTTTATGNGRAGLAYGGVSLSQALWGPSYLVGLRQDNQDRSNVAIQNMGNVTDGEITLRVTVFGTQPSGSGSTALPDVELSPGEFRQINSILTSNGLDLQEGYVRVERVSGKAPYYAYGVINDQVTSDGSFVNPIRIDDNSGFRQEKMFWGETVVPVVVESGLYESELILTNIGTGSRTVALLNRSEAVQAPDQTASVEVLLQAGEQKIIRNYIQWLREQQLLKSATVGFPYAGTVSITANNSPGLSGVFAAVRVSTKGPGRFGVFYPAVGLFTQRDAWLYGLQQNATSRSNLALVNLGSEFPYKIELFDGDTGLKVATVDLITPTAWLQLNGVLAEYAPGVTQGYARVSRQGGFGPFITYAVINDGGAPGERTGDGAFIASSP